MHGIGREETGVTSDHVEGLTIYLHVGRASKQITNLLKPWVCMGQGTASTRNGPQYHFKVLGANVVCANQTAVTRSMVIRRRVAWNRVFADEIF
jgi:hypothetical protein